VLLECVVYGGGGLFGCAVDVDMGKGVVYVGVGASVAPVSVVDRARVCGCGVGVGVGGAANSSLGHACTHATFRARAPTQTRAHERLVEWERAPWSL
jgi:hypothetical protein